MEKRVALFEVKAIDGADPHGEFEAILSVPTVDRDGEVIDGRAFEPLPAQIPIHRFHDFSSPVATATPFYEGDVLKARGTFDPDPESQAIRQKVGRSIRYMSVGFMAATRSDQDGVPHITRAELLEASFVSVPSNREAAILAVKGAELRSRLEKGFLTPAAAAAMEDIKALNEKPFANEHACRLEDPSQFDRFRRDNTKDPNVIIGFRADGTSTAQAFRYPTATWTESRAQAHCSDHDGSFEAASKSSDPEVKAGRVFSAKNEATLRQAVTLLTTLLEQLAAPDEGAAPKSPAATDPEVKTAAPVAAVEPPPADVPVGQVYAALMRAQAALSLTT
jgi:HK97 family phage prohead protease